jgi:hypothetical protein
VWLKNTTNGGCFRATSAAKHDNNSQASELGLSCVTSSNHLYKRINHRSTYQTQKNHRHQSLHALSELWPRLHAWPSHHNLETRYSKHQLEQRPPPTNSSSPDLSTYGGKSTTGIPTHLHASTIVPESMFTRFCTAATLALQNISFRAPKRKRGTTIGIIVSRSIRGH